MNVLQQVVIPDYRLPLFLLLKDSLGDPLEVFAGETDYNITPKSTPLAWDHFHKVKNHYFLKRRILWQGGLLRKMLTADLLIANANMRNLTVVSVLFLRRILRKQTILWGHATGKTKIGSMLRGLFLRHNTDCFNHLGLVPHADMPEIYRQHDIYISLEKDAPCPNAVIEAMSSGLPVAGFNWGAMPEIVNKENGILIKTQKSETVSDQEVIKLIHGLTQIINNYESFSLKSRERTLDYFSIEKVCTDYLDAFIC